MISIPKRIITLSVILISAVCYYAWNKRHYFEPNEIINPPVTTIPILKSIGQIPNDEGFEPPYRYTRNVGFIRHPKGNGYLAAHHIDIGPSTTSYRTKLFIFELDDELNVVRKNEIHKNHFYKFQKNHWSGNSTAQDPRLFAVKDKVYMLYNDLIKSPHREVYITEIDYKSDNIYAKEVKQIEYLEGVWRDQKNWTPFIYNDTIYFIYTIDPNIILEWDPETNKLLEKHDNGPTFNNVWNLGELRGGTPAIYVEEYDAYVTFFHSCLRYWKKDPKITQIHQPFSRIYYMGALLFSAHPPFNVIAYTPTPLSLPGQYDNFNQNYHIIFPCGLIEDGDSLLISTGIQDIQCDLLQISKRDLWKQLSFLKEHEREYAYKKP